MRAALVIAIGGLALAGAVQAEGSVEQDYITAVKRVHGCFDASAGGAPRDSLRSAVAAARILCTPQIKAAHAASDRKVEAENPALADDILAARKRAAWAELDNDLVTLVANRTGIRN